MKLKNTLMICLVFAFTIILGSQSLKPALAADALTPIMGPSQVIKEQMAMYLRQNNSAKTSDYINNFVSLVIQDANAEGIRPEAAFALMMKETNFLKFGGTVVESQNNFGGLGVTGAPGVVGDSYPTIDAGIKAVIQHLQAYATTAPLQSPPVVDLRYGYVSRGKAPNVEWLGINENPYHVGWATDPGYGLDVVARMGTIKSLLPMVMFIDRPGNGGVVNGSTVVSGWTINSTGLQSVAVQRADGTVIGSKPAAFFLRPDVDAAYSSYPAGVPRGFSYVIDTTMLPNGPQVVKVTVTGKPIDPTQAGETVSMNLNLKVNNPPMRIVLDNPAVNSTVRGNISLTGWAQNISGLKTVVVQSAEGKILATAPSLYTRADVSAAFPGYPTQVGYTIPLDTRALPNGSQVLSVIAIGNNGEWVFWKLPLSVDNSSKVYVDQPLNGDSKAGKLAVSGWALSSTGVQRVEIQKSDGTVLTSISAFSPRPDVNAVYPGYPGGANSGFSAAIDTTRFPNGWQTVKVVSYGSTDASGRVGDTVAQTLQININNPPMYMYIDRPSNQGVVRGQVELTGWALNVSGLKSVVVRKADGTTIKSISDFYLRSDLPTVFPGYPSGYQAGFTTQLDSTLLPNGSQVLKVVAVANNGETRSYSVSVVVDNSSKLWIDYPVNGSAIRGKSVVISGWALNETGVNSVTLKTADGKVLGVVNKFLSRPDVNAVFPGYPGGANSGYALSFDSTVLPDGLQTLVVVADGIPNSQGFKGETVSRSLTVRVDNASMIMWVDTPASGSSIKNSVVISGWAVNVTGLSSIKISQLGGAVLAQITGGFYQRPDVTAAFPGYNSLNGFSYTLDTTRLANGPQTLQVLTVGKNGEQRSWNVPVVVNNLPARIVLDTPGDLSVIRSGKIVTFRGWALNVSGLQRVDLLGANGAVLKSINSGFYLRPDVNAVYPGYVNGQSAGYSLDLDTTGLPLGMQTIVVRAVGNNGEAKDLNLSIIISLNNTVVLDPGHGGRDPGAPAYNKLFYEKDLNLAVALRVRNLLLAKGFQVVMTRDSDVDLDPNSTYSVSTDLHNRVAIANASQGSVFLSLHANSFSSTTATGVIGEYFDINSGYAVGDTDYDPRAAANWQLSQDLANRVASSLASATSQNLRPSESHSFVVLEDNWLPASLLEMGFLSNPDTAVRMNTDAWRDKAASGIVDGITSYFAAH